MPPWDAMGPLWAEMCRAAGHANFAWAHNGSNKNGFVELCEGGRVETPWCEGTWTQMEDPDLLDISFGSSRHICRVKEGGFEVEMKFLLRTGKPSYKPNQPHTVGWISTEKRAAPRRDPVAPRKRQAPSEKEERDIPDLPGAPTFSQRDIKFEPFFNRWTSQKAARLAESALPTILTMPEGRMPATPMMPAMLSTDISWTSTAGGSSTFSSLVPRTQAPDSPCDID